jgi:hypothetical protein
MSTVRSNRFIILKDFDFLKSTINDKNPIAGIILNTQTK